MSSTSNDDGFREIQLNGKQLVFLFMAATVVSVVIFLCGVLVGRGVRPERASSQDVASTEISPDQSAAAAGAAAQAATPPPVATTESPAPIGDPTYPGRLTSNTLPQETLKPMPEPVRDDVEPVKPQSSKPQPSKPQAAKPLPPKPQAPAEQVPASVSASEPSGPGFAVQVSIFDNRREADALAKQLIAKGYPAFVMDPVKGAPRPIYRVRVGKYKNRKDAEAISARLEKAEQFTPWIAR
ncbi:MAG: SPOR domain-containing protein [Vicinamibacterales bacterium]|nr:SPOR domain-containing protein [Vicinamibacterales bacterium]